jgi:hypothetical protein
MVCGHIIRNKCRWVMPLKNIEGGSIHGLQILVFVLDDLDDLGLMNAVMYLPELLPMKPNKPYKYAPSLQLVTNTNGGSPK